MYILFDIGATTMRVALSTNGKSVGNHIIGPTPKNFNDAVDQFGKVVQQLAQGNAITAVIGGVSGSLSRDKRTIARSLLTDWAGKPFASALEQVVGAQVFLENDAALVGLGEAVFGAGKGKEIVAYLTISTSVGGARIVKGQVDDSVRGFEPGHQIVDASLAFGKEYPAGRLESLVSGTSLFEKYGKIPSQINDLDVWEEVAKALAVGVVNAIVHWSPDVVVLGGGVVIATKFRVERVAEHVGTMLRIYPEPPPVVKADLDDVGGLHGALALLQKMQRR